jgi:hypothetical protein
VEGARRTSVHSVSTDSTHPKVARLLCGIQKYVPNGWVHIGWFFEASVTSIANDGDPAARIKTAHKDVGAIVVDSLDLLSASPSLIFEIDRPHHQYH